MAAVMKPSPYRTDDERWQAVASRDRGADGAFLYGVVTTGVYCRPGCSSRRPRRDNVRYFDSPEQARAAGFRACLRCRPEAGDEGPDADLLRRACTLMETAGEAPSRAALAARLAVSESRLARLFRDRLGVTPGGWWRARRAERLRDGLARGASVTRAMHDAGYGSSSRLYEAGGETLLGMSPSRYRDGAPGERIEWATAPCALGRVLVATSARGVSASVSHANSVQATWDDYLDFAYVFSSSDADHPATPASLPLDLRGTAFQRRVWTALREIPPGRRVSYGELAARLGMARGARAVAGAVAANPLAVLVPCHRVVGADGELRGYRWGVERKRELLAREEGDTPPARP